MVLPIKFNLGYNSSAHFCSYGSRHAPKRALEMWQGRKKVPLNGSERQSLVSVRWITLRTLEHQTHRLLDVDNCPYTYYPILHRWHVLVPRICFACQAQNWLKQMQEADPTLDQYQDMENIGTVWNSVHSLGWTWIRRGKTWLSIAFEIWSIGPFWSNVQATWSPVMESWPIYCEQMLEDDRAGKIWKDLVSDAVSNIRPASSRYHTVAVCKAGIQPDEVTYATVISALTKDRGSEKQCPEAAGSRMKPHQPTCRDIFGIGSVRPIW